MPNFGRISVDETGTQPSAGPARFVRPSALPCNNVPTCVSEGSPYEAAPDGLLAEEITRLRSRRNWRSLSYASEKYVSLR